MSELPSPLAVAPAFRRGVVRLGDWAQTVSGRQFWPLDPRPEELDLSDIAHALSMLCRFNGHCREFYSVAEHSVRVSLECPPEHARWGLLHDAAEAYIGDMIRPLKRSMPHYRAAETRIVRAIADRWNLDLPIPEAVHRADLRLLYTERRDLMVLEHPWEGDGTVEPLPERIAPCPMPAAARAMFLARAQELGLDN